MMPRVRTTTVYGATVEYYFDRHERAWCAYGIDPETEYQIGPACYDIDRDMAIAQAAIDANTESALRRNAFYS